VGKEPLRAEHPPPPQRSGSVLYLATGPLSGDLGLAAGLAFTARSVSRAHLGGEGPGEALDRVLPSCWYLDRFPGTWPESFFHLESGVADGSARQNVVAAWSVVLQPQLVCCEETGWGVVPARR